MGGRRVFGSVCGLLPTPRLGCKRVHYAGLSAVRGGCVCGDGVTGRWVFGSVCVVYL